MKKRILFYAIFCAALLVVACKGKTADQSSADSALSIAASPTQETLGGTYWKAVEFRNTRVSADGLRTELFLWKDGTGRFLVRPDSEYFGFGYGGDVMCDWTLNGSELALTWPDGRPLFACAFEAGRLVLQFDGSWLGVDGFPIVMARTAMPLYGARWNEVFRLYTAELLAAQEYSGAVSANFDIFDPDSRYPVNLYGAQLADLNFDGIPELFLFDSGASASQSVCILTISGGSVQMVFKGDANMGFINLYRKKSGGSLVYSFESANGGFDNYEGVYYLTDANTKMDKTFASSAKIAEFSSVDYYDKAFEYQGSKYTINGSEVTEEVYKRLEGDLYKDYEKISRKPVTMQWEWERKSDESYDQYLVYCDEWDISMFLNSYQPESGN